MEIEIEYLRTLCNDDNLFLTQHALKRMLERNISYENVKNIILNGEIIEQYPDDYPNPSCLIFGIVDNVRNLHIVIGVCDDKLWVITAYEPTTDKWNDDFKTRRNL